METCTIIRRGAFCVHKPGFLMLGHILLTHTHVHTLELSDSENFTIMIVEIVFTIMNAIPIADLLSTVYTYKIKHGLHNF